MADPKKTDLDAGSPHLRPDDYRALGLGEFSGSQQYIDMDGTPTAEDERLCEDIRARIKDFARVEVQVVNRSVRLSGIVEDRYERERAELSAREIARDATIHNDIRVQPASEGGGPILTTREPGANNSGSTQRS